MDQKLRQDYLIGHNIRSLRLRAKMTQSQVALRLQLANIDMSRDFYAHIESGSYNVRVSELVALRHIFNCTYEDFFAGF